MVMCFSKGQLLWSPLPAVYEPNLLSAAGVGKVSQQFPLQDCTQSIQILQRESKTKGNFPAAPHLPAVALLTMSWWTSHVPWWIPWPGSQREHELFFYHSKSFVSQHFFGIWDAVGMKQWWEYGNSTLQWAAADESGTNTKPRIASPISFAGTADAQLYHWDLPVWEPRLWPSVQHINHAASLSSSSLKSQVLPSLRDIRNTLRMIQTCSQKQDWSNSVQSFIFCLVLCCIYDFHYNQESHIMHQACQTPWFQFLWAGSTSASPELKAPSQHFSQFYASSSHQRGVNDLLVVVVALQFHLTPSSADEFLSFSNLPMAWLTDAQPAVEHDSSQQLRPTGNLRSHPQNYKSNVALFSC